MAPKDSLEDELSELTMGTQQQQLDAYSTLLPNPALRPALIKQLKQDGGMATRIIDLLSHSSIHTLQPLIGAWLVAVSSRDGVPLPYSKPQTSHTLDPEAPPAAEAAAPAAARAVTPSVSVTAAPGSAEAAAVETLLKYLLDLDSVSEDAEAPWVLQVVPRVASDELSAAEVCTGVSLRVKQWTEALSDEELHSGDVVGGSEVVETKRGPKAVPVPMVKTVEDEAEPRVEVVIDGKSQTVAWPSEYHGLQSGVVTLVAKLKFEVDVDTVDILIQSQRRCIPKNLLRIRMSRISIIAPALVFWCVERQEMKAALLEHPKPHVAVTGQSKLLCFCLPRSWLEGVLSRDVNRLSGAYFHVDLKGDRTQKQAADAPTKLPPPTQAAPPAPAPAPKPKPRGTPIQAPPPGLPPPLPAPAQAAPPGPAPVTEGVAASSAEAPASAAPPAAEEATAPQTARHSHIPPIPHALKPWEWFDKDAKAGKGGTEAAKPAAEKKKSDHVVPDALKPWAWGKK